MTKKHILMAPVYAVALLAIVYLTGCGSVVVSETGGGLAGAWRGKVQFTTGDYAAIKDLEFMYVFNAGGTMTESSNYDGSPPVPPAYGVWKQVGPRQFEARYEYYWTKAPANFDEIAKGGGWSPGGRGVLSQTITLSEDGNSFDSTIKYEVFDQLGKPTSAPSAANGQGLRIKF
jgi:hypothetical protein